MPRPAAKYDITAEDRTRTAILSAERRLQGLSRSFTAIGRVAAGAFAGIGVGAIIRASTEQESALRQIEQRIKSTGGAAGLSAKQIETMASSLQNVTTYGDDAILAMQGILLTFTQIRGDNFRATTEAILDMSVAMDQDLKSSAVQLGKALNDPVKNLSALTRVGVQFSKDQETVIKRMAETGDLAGAQRLILQELQREFGGAARAARDTFGGALTGLRNAFGDLLEGSSGLKESAAEIEKFSKILQDPRTKASADALMSSLISGFSRLTGLISTSIEGWQRLFRIARDALNIQDTDSFNSLYDRMGELIERRDELEDRLKNPLVFGFARSTAVSDLRDVNNEMALINAQIKQLQKSGFLASVGEQAGGVVSGVFDRPTSPSSGGGGSASAAARGAQTAALDDMDRALNLVIAQFDELDQAEARAIAGLDPQPVDEFAQSLNELLRSLGTSQSELDEETRQLGILYRAMDQFPERADEIQEAIDKITFKDMADGAEEDFDRMSDAAREAYEEIRYFFADSLYDAMQGRFDGILESFKRMLDRMAAEAIAKDLADLIFQRNSTNTSTGGSGGGGGSNTDFLTQAALYAAQFFGGGAAHGGPVSAGKMWEVGEQGPELLRTGGRNYLLSGRDGYITPNNKLAAAGMPNISINNYFQGAQDESSLRRASNAVLGKMARQLQVISARDL